VVSTLSSPGQQVIDAQLAPAVALRALLGTSWSITGDILQLGYSIWYTNSQVWYTILLYSHIVYSIVWYSDILWLYYGYISQVRNGLSEHKKNHISGFSGVVTQISSANMWNEVRQIGWASQHAAKSGVSRRNARIQIFQIWFSISSNNQRTPFFGDGSDWWTLRVGCSFLFFLEHHQKKKGREVPKFDPLIRGGRQEDLFDTCCSGWNQIRHFWCGKKPEILSATK
jgi:hypothetical protein